MNQALHILRKDVRRLWPAVLLTLVLLGVLAWEDSRRADFTPSALEGILNLLLPAVWAALVAAVVQEEGFVNDRAFWLTRPYSRRSLALAKLLFVGLFVHAACLLAHCYILTARGFLPWEHMPHLFWKQLLLAGALTLPAAALAAVTSNLARFAFCAAVIVTISVALRMGVESHQSPWLPRDTIRRAIPFALIALSSASILALQYGRRRILLSRGVGAGFASAAAAVFALTPAEATIEARCALAPDAAIAPAIRYDPDAKREDNYAYVRSSLVPVILPVQIAGLENYAESGFEQLSTELQGTRVRGGLGWSRLRPLAWHRLNIERADFARFASDPVTVRGKAAITVWKVGEERTMPAVNGFAQVPGLGHCSATRTETQHGEDLLKLMCETPGELPLLTNIRLKDPSTGQEWKHRLGDSYTDVRYPAESPLSPLTRRQTFFHTRPLPSSHPGDRWTVPDESVARSQFTLSAFEVAGCTVVRYEIPGVQLSRHIAKTR